MSINVTVSGNPVRINRGKMVTSYDPAKAEFEKRRLIRLEQVRQQSKDIAENLRNKLKKGKSKCLSEIEKDGEVKLKNWQARKLLELQNQYQEALDELGLGHKNATQIEEEEEIYIEQQDHNEEVARERGRVASEWLQIEKNEENLKKAKPRQRKIFTNDMENSRSNKIIGGQKTKKAKHTAKKAKKDSFDSDSENRVPLLTLEEETSERSDSSVEEITRKRSGGNTKIQQTTTRICRDQQTSAIDFHAPTSEKAAQTTPSILPTLSAFPLDTRISERIKRRTRVNPTTDYCDLVDKFTPTCCNCCCHPSRHQHENVPDKVTHHLNEERFTQTDDPVQKPQTVISEGAELLRNEFENAIRNSIDSQSKTGTFYTERVPSKTSNNLLVSQKLDDRKSAPLSRTTIPHKSSDEKNNQNEQPISTQLQKGAPFPQRLDRPVPHQSEQPIPTQQQKGAPFPQRTDRRRTVPVYDKNTDGKSQNVKSKIPPKPKVTLTSSKDRPVYIGTDQPVQYYDHPNRFTKTYLPKSSHVEKIDDEEIIVSPNILSEEEIRDKMRQRDIEAHKRGQLALEKEKMQREYRDLMKKLPALQKQERIFEIGADREKYHMARDRLEELEKKRQNKLDNAYEELFVRKPAVVTLPRRTDEEEKQSLNLANWDVDFDRPETDQNRYETLNHLLSSLKSQKESLLKEIESTLSKETLAQLAKSSSDDVKSKSTDYTKVRRKRSRDDRPTSPTSSDVVLEESSETTTQSKKSTGAPSPRKKAKVKSSRKTLVLQNTSTQTTPKTELQSAATSPITTQFNTCTCTKDSCDDVCEIVIKIKEDDKPEVKVNPSFAGRSIKIVTEPDENPKDSKKATSWREQLSQSAVSQSTTSTSYLDPPGKKKSAKKPVVSPDPGEVSRSTNSTTSKSTPGEKQLDPRLLTYIKKLLKMSRTSIDQLTVSTASEVSTPTQSVIETPSNNPLSQLMNVMKYFNINAAELEKQLSYTSDESSKLYNTKESVTISSEGDKSHVQSYTESVSSKKVKESEKMLQFADMAASYTKKINDLTAKIEEVRAEKKKILESSSSGSDKDLTTTSYRDLPEKKVEEEQEITQQNNLDELLNIDYGYAETLKQLSSQEVQSEKMRTEGDPSTDDELLNRLKRLLEVKPPKEKAIVIQTEKKLVQESDGDTIGVQSQKRIVENRKHGKTKGILTEHTSVTLKPPENKNEESTPLFLDIPKLPKLEVPSLDKKNKRPPPSKGLRAIAAHIPVEPHELSTIVEADSQLSTKASSPSKGTKSADVPDLIAEAAKSSSDDVSEFDTMETMLISIGMEWAIPTLKKTREALAMASSSSGSGSKDSGTLSLREFLSKISATKSEEGSSSLSESQGISLIQIDHRRTSTPIVGDKKEGPVFVTDSDVSSVRELSEKTKDSEKFYDLNERSLSKTS